MASALFGSYGLEVLRARDIAQVGLGHGQHGAHAAAEDGAGAEARGRRERRQGGLDRQAAGVREDLLAHGAGAGSIGTGNAERPAPPWVAPGVRVVRCTSAETEGFEPSMGL